MTSQLLLGVFTQSDLAFVVQSVHTAGDDVHHVSETQSVFQLSEILKINV